MGIHYILPMNFNRFNRALTAGAIIAGSFWSLLLVWHWQTANEWILSVKGLWYNIPISIVFVILALELCFSLFPETIEKLKLHWPFLVIWGLGFIQLYFRLVLGNIDISGHLTWLTFLIVHCSLREIPRWFLGVTIAVWCQCIYFYFVIFPSPADGIRGILLGGGLVVLLIWLNREKQRKFPEKVFTALVGLGARAAQQKREYEREEVPYE